SGPGVSSRTSRPLARTASATEARRSLGYRAESVVTGLLLLRLALMRAAGAARFLLLSRTGRLCADSRFLRVSLGHEHAAAHDAASHDLVTVARKRVRDEPRPSSAPISARSSASGGTAGSVPSMSSGSGTSVAVRTTGGATSR